MPNWCENKLIVQGPEPILSKFVDLVAADDTELSIEKIIPTPEGADAYNFHVNAWGTKWDVDARIASRDEEIVEYMFDSAWSPPIDAIKTFGQKFPDLCFTLHYAEGGVGFGGTYTVETIDGELYDSSDETGYEEGYEAIYGHPPEDYSDEDDEEEGEEDSPYTNETETKTEETNDADDHTGKVGIA
jgi:hypothetical protein